MKFTALFSSLMLSLLLAPAAIAEIDETSRETDGHIIYFNVFNSTFLTPEVAQQYGLTRSNYRAILNLAVHEKSTPEGKPIRAILEGTVTNIVQQQRDLQFKEIVEGDAIYYLSDFRITDDDLLTFDIKVRTHADSPGYDLRFKRRVYTSK
ncbi:MAG: DUF4426 domain-containing protein [Pseudomonadales bacterium]|jgi:hypothetical protein